MVTMTEREYFDDYRSRGYSRGQARHMAKRRYMTDVIRDIRKNQPEKYAELLQRIVDNTLEEERELQGRTEAERRVEEIRRTATVRFRNALMCTGLFLPEFNLAPVEAEGYWGESGCESAIVSFRKWEIECGGLLHGVGVGSGYSWREINVSDVVPDLWNGHGLYSIMLDSNGLMSNANAYVGDYCGLLELRGKVVDHEDGVLRAEWARILCIWVTLCSPEVYSAVRLLYANYPSTPIYVCTKRQVREALFRVTAWQEFGR